MYYCIIFGGMTMERVKRVNEGSLKVSDEVIETVAKIAACDVDGVVSLTKAAVSFNSLFMKSPHNDAVKIKLYGDVVEITVSVIIKAGYKVTAVAENIQTRVKDDIQGMTSVTVAKVNVLITGIVFDENKQ